MTTPTPTLKLAQPREEHLLEETYDTLKRSGLADIDARWLSEFFFSPGLLNLAEMETDAKRIGDFNFALESGIVRSFKDHPADRDLQMGLVLLALAGLSGCSHLLTLREPILLPKNQTASENPSIPPWVERFFRESKINPAKILKLLKPDWDDHQKFIWHVLLPYLDLSQLINWSRLPKTKRSGFSNKDFEDFDLLEFWLILELKAKYPHHDRFGKHEIQCDDSLVLRKIVPTFAGLPREDLAASDLTPAIGQIKSRVLPLI